MAETLDPFAGMYGDPVAKPKPKVSMGTAGLGTPQWAPPDSGQISGTIDPATGQMQAGEAVPDTQILADADQAIAALGGQQQGSMAQGAIDGAYGANLARNMALRERWRQLQPIRGSRANVRYPIVQQRAGEQLAGDGAPVDFPEFQPEPFATPERMMGESDADYMARVGDLEAAHNADQMLAKAEYDAQVAQAQSVPAARDVGRDGNIGELEAERRLSEQATEAGIAGAEQMAYAETQAAEATRGAIQEARLANRERQDFLEQSRQAVATMQNVEAEARKKLEEMPALNGRRFVEEMGLGAKILAVVASGLGGATGNNTTIPMLMQMAQEDLQEQKLNHELGIQNYAEAKSGVGTALSVYQAVRDGIGDESVSDQMYLDLVMEDAAQMLRAEAASAELPELKIAYEQQALQIEEGLRNRRAQLQETVATTPKNIGFTVDPFKAERRMVEKEMDENRAQLDKLELKGVDVAEGRDKAAIDLESKRLDQERKDLRGEGGIYRESADLADKIAPKQGIVNGISDLKKEFRDGIPGVGALPNFEKAASWAEGVIEGKPDKAGTFEKRLWNILKSGLRDESGAVLSDSEIDGQVDLLMDGYDEINGEQKVWRNLDAYADRLNQEIDVRARGRSKEAQAYLSGNQRLPERDPMSLGKAPSRSVVRVK